MSTPSPVVIPGLNGSNPRRVVNPALADKVSRRSFTEQVKKTIITALLNGCHEDVAASKAHISISVYYHWKLIGSVGPDEPGYDEEFHNFFLDVERAQAENESELVSNWNEQATGDWKAAQAFLAARFPHRWNPNRKIEVSGPDGRPIEFTILMDTQAEVADGDTYEYAS